MADMKTAAETAKEQSIARGRAFIRAWKPVGWRSMAGEAATAMATHQAEGQEELRGWCLFEATYAFDGGKERAQALVGGSGHATIATGRDALEQSLADEDNLKARIAKMEEAAKGLLEYAETRGRMLWLIQQSADAKGEVESVREMAIWLSPNSSAPFITAMRAKASEVMQPPGALYGERAPSERLQLKYAKAMEQARVAEHVSFDDIEQFFEVGGPLGPDDEASTSEESQQEGE